jgi:opacity protein-like surface antigen
MMAMEIEATSVPHLRGTLSSGGGVGNIRAILPGASVKGADGRAVYFTTNIRVQLPTSSARITPYFIAGGGSASIRRSTDIMLPIPLAISPGIPFPIPIPSPIIEHITQSSTNLTLTLGGGVDVSVASHVSVGGDVRYYRLLGDEDSNVGRFGAVIRYRF